VLHRSLLSATLHENNAQESNLKKGEGLTNNAGFAESPDKSKDVVEEAAFFCLLASVFGMWGNGAPPVLKEWPDHTWQAWNGEQVYDAYAKVRSTWRRKERMGAALGSGG
jgi:putative NADPH-quinone reductase